MESYKEFFTESLAKTYGLSELHLNKRTATIYHGGNMGNTHEHVRDNVDAMHGKPVFNALRKVGVESGHPSYAYTLKVPRKQYDQIAG